MRMSVGVIFLAAKLAVSIKLLNAHFYWPNNRTSGSSSSKLVQIQNDVGTSMSTLALFYSKSMAAVYMSINRG